MERIYVAGAYCPQNCSLHDASRIAQQNTDKAIDFFMANDVNEFYKKQKFAPSNVIMDQGDINKTIN